MRVGVLQSDAARLSPAERLERLDAALAGQRLDLLVTPELLLSGYNVGEAFHDLAEPVDGPSLTAAARIARAYATALVLGFAERADGALYNAAVLIGPDGERLAHHRKRRASPGSFEARFFSPGTTSTVFDLAGVRCAILICYEIEFPEYARIAARDGAAVLLVPTALSDDWADVAGRMVPTRAFENGVWIAYANHAGCENGLTYLGGGRIAGPDWGQDAVSGAGPDLISADIDPARIDRARARLPYLRAAPRGMQD